jgi:hypothetical protein
VSEGGGKSGNEVRETDPPDPVVAFAQESCEGVRPLRGLVEAPVMRRDGTIIATPGYDPATRLFAAFDADAASRALATIPDAPTQADARAALDILHKLVCDFPFEKPAHRATWVAGLLTMLAREMFDGPAPLFLARANTRGSGKTLLTELPHIIACGDRPAMLGWSGDEVEFEKQVTTEAIAGSACVVIDNITGTFKSATLDRILTSGKHRARILGGNQKFDGPMRAVWWASGNNLDTSDDMASRRIAPIELVATEARPEDRSGFTADAVEEEDGGSGETGTAALRAYARRNRWHLVSAAMTILRAWHCAGRPVPRDLSAWGSFESWSRVVRGALIFAGLKKNREEAAAELQKADRDYERGEKAAAVAVYKHRFAFAEDKAQALKRIVEHETEAANEAEARQWIERGIREKIAAGYAGAAGRLYAQAKKEHDDAEARKLAEKKAQEEARKQGVAVVASDLRAEYGRSQAEADRKYKGKTVTITGRLNKVIREGIAEGVADDIVVVVDEDAEPFIQCYFALKHDGALARLSPGQAVVIRGRCAGIHQPTREIRVRGCELVP